MRRSYILPIAAGLLACPVTSHAQVAAPGQTLTLSDAEKAALLTGHSEASVDAARAGLAGDDGAGADNPRRAIHGEMGVMVGTGGTRGAYGTAAIPLGQNAGAIVSFESSRYGYRR